MIEVATGLSDVDQQVDDKGETCKPDYVYNRLTMVSLWPFEWLLRFHQHIKLGVGTCDYIHRPTA